ncbi:MAG: hypothetical protein SGPRY_013643, partial [Prymnesium sp.]
DGHRFFVKNGDSHLELVECEERASAQSRVPWPQASSVIATERRSSEKAPGETLQATLTLQVVKDGVLVPCSKLGVHMGPDGRVHKVDEGSSASDALLCVGDLVTSVDATPVTRGKSALDHMGRISQLPHSRVLEVERDNRASSAKSPKWIYEKIVLPPSVKELISESGIELSTGGAVMAVQPRTAASDAGIKTGDLIVEINGVLLGAGGADALRVWDQTHRPSESRILLIARPASKDEKVSPSPP